MDAKQYMIFEEQFHAPAVAVKLAYQLGFGRQIVGEEDVGRSIIRFYIGDFTQFFGIQFTAFISAEITDDMGYDTFRQPPLPCPGLQSDVGFGTQDEETAHKIYLEKVT